MRATLTAPVPISLDCTGGAGVPGGGFLLNTSEMPEQPARMANTPASTAPEMEDKRNIISVPMISVSYLVRTSDRCVIRAKLPE
jgi:hypothetical protein